MILTTSVSSTGMRDADAFLSSLIDGYETVLGPSSKAARSSVGQWQRVGASPRILSPMLPS